jgi:hypothetical protein
MNDAPSNSPALEMVPIVTTDQLRIAVASALTAAAQGSTAGPLGTGPYSALTGEVAARMAAAIAYAFPPESGGGEPLLKGLIWRGIFAFSDVVSDNRFIAFGRSDENTFSVGQSLMAAVAGLPMPFGGDVPVDAIYASACDAIAYGGHVSEMTTIIADGLCPAETAG